jgi:Ran GTPase-activating protein (RanGAP) involved in mRNA processing and transport
LPLGQQTLNLTVLDISNNLRPELNDATLRCIAGWLKYNTTLIKLIFTYNPFNIISARTLADALSYNTSLQELDLSENKITETTIEALAQGLHYNRTLKILRLDDNQEIGTIGITHLTEALINSSITFLALNRCALNNQMLGILMETLQHNILNALELNRNVIGDEGVNELCRKININTSLTSLDLTFTYASEPSAKSFYGMFTQHPTLTKLDLRKTFDRTRKNLKTVGFFALYQKEIHCETAIEIPSPEVGKPRFFSNN